MAMLSYRFLSTWIWQGGVCWLQEYKNNPYVNGLILKTARNSKNSKQKNVLRGTLVHYSTLSAVKLRLMDFPHRTSSSISNNIKPLYNI